MAMETIKRDKLRDKNINRNKKVMGKKTVSLVFAGIYSPNLFHLVIPYRQ